MQEDPGQESVTENGTVDNIHALIETARDLNVPVFVSLHYDYPHDHQWKFEGALESLMHRIMMSDRKDAKQTATRVLRCSKESNTLTSESREPKLSDDSNLDDNHGDCGGGQRADGRAVLCLLRLGDGGLDANAGIGGNESDAADQPNDPESGVSERILWNGFGLHARHDHLRMAAATRVRLGDRGSLRVSVWRFHGDGSFQHPA
ncbi:cysteine hydrolase [Stieleria neptunia]|uniref:cysteine hydrolase n=1 Tax=Stieleria neptunia TaxID=2527979 RepID=UPI001E558013|nr:cysteine hydrolase [Stieleria neptunia]